MRQQPAGAGVNLALIVTPMLDMSFQLLAFFIMTYHPLALEGHIDGKLMPPADHRVGADKKNPLPELDPLVNPDEHAPVTTVIVRAVAKGQVEAQRHDGEPSQVLVKRVEDLNPVPVADTDSTWAEGIKTLARELKRQAQGQAPQAIKIQGDGNLKHQFAVEVYDACRRAGYRDIAFVHPKRDPK